MNTAYRVWDGEKMHYWDDEEVSLTIEGESWYLYRKDTEFITINKTASTALMWGTGLKDKSLYDGDIVKYGTFNYQNGVICYDMHQAMFKIVPVQLYLANSGNGGWRGNSIGTTVSLKVIGNIYQNPELLEGVK
ncbi:YopX family protein [Bacillus atrophaeus]|uniref:YopX family protein n=1 Tax=Bacillus atrophaeus TaxID=1452 RepID=UPI003CE83D5D